MSNAELPNPLHVVSAWIKSLDTAAAKRVSPKLSATMPAIRIADVGPRDRGPEEQLARVQVECWADDDETASRMARQVEAGLPDLAGVYLFDDPDDVDAETPGGDISAGPFVNNDPNSERYRYQLDVEFWLYPHTP